MGDQWTFLGTAPVLQTITSRAQGTPQMRGQNTVRARGP